MSFAASFIVHTGAGDTVIYSYRFAATVLLWRYQVFSYQASV